jgi:hypothetical protein
MLPGFRFLFAAIVLSMSILVFGLGAAALLRAAHEEFASTPRWHATPETIFAQQGEATKPVLAMLRVEPAVAEPKVADNIPAAAAPAEQAAIAATPAEPEPEKIAALKPEDSPQPEAAKPEIPLPEAPTQNEAVAAQAIAPASTAETKVVATEQALPSANEAAPAAPEQASVPNSPDSDIASTKIATLGGPPVTIETAPPAKAAAARSDKKPRHAHRASRHRRIALPARLAGQAPQQPANPFAQPTIR